MSTTALIVEFLVAGIVATIWIALFLLALLGLPTGGLVGLGVSELLAPYLAVSYVLGVVLNRVCDFAFKSHEMKISRPIWADSEHDYPFARMYIFAYSDNLKKYLDFLWSLVRIFRVSLLNVALLWISFTLFWWLQCEGSVARKLVVSLGATLTAGVLDAVLLLSWRKVTTNYHLNTRTAYKILRDERETRASH